MNLCLVLLLSSTAYDRLLRSPVSCAHLRVKNPLSWLITPTKPLKSHYSATGLYHKGPCLSRGKNIPRPMANRGQMQSPEAPSGGSMQHGQALFVV